MSLAYFLRDYSHHFTQRGDAFEFCVHFVFGHPNRSVSTQIDLENDVATRLQQVGIVIYRNEMKLYARVFRPFHKTKLKVYYQKKSTLTTHDEPKNWNRKSKRQPKRRPTQQTRQPTNKLKRNNRSCTREDNTKLHTAHRSKPRATHNCAQITRQRVGSPVADDRLSVCCCCCGGGCVRAKRGWIVGWVRCWIVGRLRGMLRSEM